MQDRNNSPSEQLSPQALEDKYTDVLSHFQTMMTSNTEVQKDQHTANHENAQEAEQRPVLQQLSPVSKFLHSIQPSNIRLLETPNLDPGEGTETHAAMFGQETGEAALSQDHTPADTPKAKQLRPSPPRFTQDGSSGAFDESHVQEPCVGPQPHIPRELLQQLATQQLRITELEKELAAENQQAAAQKGFLPSFYNVYASYGMGNTISDNSSAPDGVFVCACRADTSSAAG